MPTILVVDDEQSFRTLLYEALTRAGYSVVLADNGQEALAKTAENISNIPLVVTDFSMPGISGIDLVRQLRQRRPDIKGILLTGHWIHPLPEDLDVLYLTKPCAISKFLASVKELLRESEAGQT